MKLGAWPSPRVLSMGRWHCHSAEIYWLILSSGPFINNYRSLIWQTDELYVLDGQQIPGVFFALSKKKVYPINAWHNVGTTEHIGSGTYFVRDCAQSSMTIKKKKYLTPSPLKGMGHLWDFGTIGWRTLLQGLLHNQES